MNKITFIAFLINLALTGASFIILYQVLGEIGLWIAVAFGLAIHNTHLGTLIVWKKEKENAVLYGTHL